MSQAANYGLSMAYSRCPFGRWLCGRLNALVNYCASARTNGKSADRACYAGGHLKYSEQLLTPFVWRSPRAAL